METSKAVGNAMPMSNCMRFLHYTFVIWQRPNK